VFLTLMWLMAWYVCQSNNNSPLPDRGIAGEHDSCAYAFTQAQSFRSQVMSPVGTRLGSKACAFMRNAQIGLARLNPCASMIRCDQRQPKRSAAHSGTRCGAPE